jgi:hypothetical protein
MEKGCTQEDQKQSQILAARREHKGDEKNGGHADSPRHPRGTENSGHGKAARQSLSKGQKKESQIQNRAENTDISGTRAQPESEECNYVPRQKLPGKGIENIEQIV